MSRSIHVRVSPSGDIAVEAFGFQGKGCEDATRAIEQALGQSTGRRFKPEHRQSGSVVHQLALGKGGDA